MTRIPKDAKIVDVFRKLTPEEREKVQAIRKHVEEHLPELMAKGEVARMRHDALVNAVKLLRQTRLARGMSLADVSEASGIDKSRLSKLENDPHPNPTLETLIRIARALKADLDIVVRDAA